MRRALKHVAGRGLKLPSRAATAGIVIRQQRAPRCELRASGAARRGLQITGGGIGGTGIFARSAVFTKNGLRGDVGISTVSEPTVGINFTTGWVIGHLQ